MDSQQQQFCLKWNSFGSNLATSFANLWNSESLADVTLFCEGRQFKAHKLILAACSKHFQELFDAAPPSHAGACYVILEATTADNMQALLEFMYKGEVHVSQEALAGFLKSGESLQVKGLSQEQATWAQSQQFTSDRHGNRTHASPARVGNETPDGSQSHPATFAPIMPPYMPTIHTAPPPMGRYAPPAHMPLPPAHRRSMPTKPSPSPSQSPHPRSYRQNSSSSHAGSVADEPDTRSSPGGGVRYDDPGPEPISNMNIGNKNNGYEKSLSAADDEMDSTIRSEQGAEDLRIKMEPDYHKGGGYNASPPPNQNLLSTNYQERPQENNQTPLKPGQDIWTAKLASSKSGGIATADGKKLKCPFCDRLYGYETNLRAHIRQRHQGIRVPCPHCTRTFTRNNTVRRHIAREHRHQVTPHLPPGPLHNHAQ